MTMNNMHAPVTSTTRWTVFLPRPLQRIVAPLLGCLVLMICLFSTFGPSDSSATNTHHWSISQTHKFPRRIWQIWRFNPYAFEQRDLLVARTWPEVNPSYRYEVLTDQNDLYYIESHFGPGGLNRPDIVHTYRSLTTKIIKADLLRYLIAYVEGGIYADIDVEALRPISRFIPSRFDEKDIDLVIGIEIDQPDFKDHPILGPKSMSFCQWTFMSKPKHPVMLHLIDKIVAWVHEMARQQNVAIPDIQLDFDAVLSGTGPSAFTKAILKYINQNSIREVTWDTFHAMDESKLVGRVLVLTVEAFAAGQGHSDSGNLIPSLCYKSMTKTRQVTTTLNKLSSNTSIMHQIGPVHIPDIVIRSMVRWKSVIGKQNASSNGINTRQILSSYQRKSSKSKSTQRFRQTQHKPRSDSILLFKVCLMFLAHLLHNSHRRKQFLYLWEAN